MANLPVLNIYMVPSSDSDQSYCLKLRLSKEPSYARESNAGRLDLPFPLYLLPHIQRILNALQSPKAFTTRQLFDGDGAIEGELMHLGLLDHFGFIVPDVLVLVGARIGDVLLRISLFREHLQAFYAEAREAKGGDIVFNFDGKALELAAIPWELASDKQQPILLHPIGGDILLSCTRVILDQQQLSVEQTLLSNVQSPSTTRSAHNTPRILAAACYKGMDQEAQNLEQQARKSLEEAIGNLHVDIEHMKHVTLFALAEKLAENEPVDILDYYGHGSFNEGMASLWMEDEFGDSVLVPATRLRLLKNLPPLIVLHVCNSAQIDIRDVNSSLVTVLSNHDSIEAVVAMQGEIPMRIVAHQITPTLYKALATHESLPRAVARVRQELFIQNVDAVSWFVPVLYMRKFSQAPYLPPAILSQRSEIMEIKDSRSITYFEQVNAFFDPQLRTLDLGKEQIEQQNLAELEQSLDRVNEAIKNPDYFGKVKINFSAEGAVYIVKSISESIVEASILPILLERKKLILQRIKMLQGDVKIENLRDLIKQAPEENIRVKLGKELEALETESQMWQQQALEFERIQREAASFFENKLSDEKKQAETMIKDAERKAEVAERLTNIFRLLAAISLSLSLICIFEFCIYLLPWHWLIEHPNSYGLQASFDIFIGLLIVGILYPMWRRWCWGGGAFAVLLVVVQILGGPSK